MKPSFEWCFASAFHFFFFFFLRRAFHMHGAKLCFSSGSRALFTGSASTLFKKKNFKIGSYSTIHTFKNYIVTVFSIFSKISGI